jgi:hypothetical protein
MAPRTGYDSHPTEAWATFAANEAERTLEYVGGRDADFSFLSRRVVRRSCLRWSGCLDWRSGEAIGHWNEAPPLVSPGMFASKQCVGETSQNFGWRLLVLEYNDLKCSR